MRIPSLFLLLVAFAGCSSGTQTPNDDQEQSAGVPDSANAYAVFGTVTLTANPSAISGGGSSTLTAQFSRGKGSISPGVGSVTSGAAVSVKPSMTTTYTLTVTRFGAKTTRTATVTVQPTAPVSVSVSPATASLAAGASQKFTATVTNSTNATVTWSVLESGGGTVGSDGTYVAPQTAGTYHVVATSQADTTAKAQASIAVTGAVQPPPPPLPAIQSFSANPSSLTAGGSAALSATYSGGTGAINQGVGAIASGGSVTVTPAASTTYTLTVSDGAGHTATQPVTVNVQQPGGGGGGGTISDIIPADRLTAWNPGVSGGVPNRTTVCATVNASTYGNGSTDATAGIQAAVDSCPAGQVVMLSAGTFLINSGNFVVLNKGITLRGAGATQTVLLKTNGAKPNTEATGANPSPLIIAGPARWSSNGTNTGTTTSTNLTADAVKEASSLTVASVAGLSAGQYVLLDELSGASWQTDPAGRGQIWASPDWRVVWQLHNPAQGTDDPLIATTPTSGGAAGWFCRQDRPTNEIKQIDHITGTTIFFTTPIHISYRVSHTAQITSFGYAFVQQAGVENLTVNGGDNGNIRFQWCASCWAKAVENTVWHDEGFAVDASFRTEIRDSYVHDAAWAEPGGAGYAISLSKGSSEALIENNISIKANKVMVARSCGAGTVFGYNYTDDGYITTNTAWVEVGLNASHMVGPHHVLFEGNYGVNWDSDKTHGSAIYHTVFRNWLRGVRRDFNDTVASGDSPLRCAGAMYYSYWHTFVGNVLGAQGQMAGWVYEADPLTKNAGIWKLGWDDWSPYPVDPQVIATTLRHGNYDYVNNAVVWDPGISDHTLPNSLYLSAKPAFFNAGRGYTWPWVDPTSTTQQIYTLPAKARYDAGTPFVQP
jgi:hypothetical protein